MEHVDRGMRGFVLRPEWIDSSGLDLQRFKLLSYNSTQDPLCFFHECSIEAKYSPWMFKIAWLPLTYDSDLCTFCTHPLKNTNILILLGHWNRVVYRLQLVSVAGMYMKHRDTQFSGSCSHLMKTQSSAGHQMRLYSTEKSNLRVPPCGWKH